MTDTSALGDLETRLSAALHARADLVTPDSLRPLEVPDAPVVPLVRRRATWVLAAAACAALLTLPFVLRDAAERTEQPPSTEGPSPTTSTGPTELTGDLDGDGYDETVTMDGHGVLSVVLASSSSGTPLTADAGADGSTLVGLVKLDSSGAESVATDDRGTGRIFHITQDGLVEVVAVEGEASYPFTHDEPGQAWFINGDAFMTSFQDVGVPAAYGRVWQLNAQGRLRGTWFGEMCPNVQLGHPETCGGGSGVVSSQPGIGQVALYPKASETIHTGQSFPISIDGGGGPGTVSLDGSTLSVDFPGGSPAQRVTIPGEGGNVVYTTFMPGIEVPGIVVRQTRAGGFDWYYVVSWVAGELTVMDTSNVPDGVSSETYSGDDQATWFSATGHLFTSWPSQNGTGNFIVMRSLGPTGLSGEFVTAPDGNREICLDPPAYGAC